MLERYTPILRTLQKLSPSAHIGGGAVRDSLLERPIKDIDLFIDEAVIDKAAKLLRSTFSFVKVGEWASYLEFSDPAVARLAKFENADESIPICLIGLKFPIRMEENVRRFDFGVCMSAWNGDEVYCAPGYRTDVHNKTFTLYRADNQAQFKYSMSRFRKIVANRYDGWKLVVSAEFEDLARQHAFQETWYHDYESGDLKYREAGMQEMKPKAR